MISRSLIKRLCALLMAAFLLLPIFLPAKAENTGRTVRVAFPEQEGISQIEHSGRLSGYNYDYLEKISEFTGWKLEYVIYSSDDGNEAVGAAMDDLLNGKVDLMGPILKSAGTEGMFDFPKSNYGTVYTTLCADLNSALRKSDINTTDVLRIGLWEKASTRNKEVEDYLESESIHGEIHYYDSAEAQLEALHSGKVDVISGVSLSTPANTRIMARFAPRPYYFAATKGNETLVEELDAAICMINEMQPELQDTLFDKYFLTSVNSFRLTEAQEKVLAGIDTLRVLCVDGDAPYTYQEKGQPRGALVMALDDFAAETGIRMEYHFCENRQQAEKMLAAGEQYDLLIGMPFSSAFCAENGFVRSEPVFQAGMALLRNTSGSGFAKETVGIVRGLENSFDTTKFAGVILFDSAADCISALKAGKVDVAAGDRSVMSFYLYENGTVFSTAAISGTTHEVGIAVSRTRCLPILGILNKYIASLSTYQRTVYLDGGGTHGDGASLLRWMAQNPMLSVLAAGAFVTLMVGSVLLYIHTLTMRKKDQQLSIALQAKSDFLSRMSHDIRTPLNGIIGLLKINEDHFGDEALMTENNRKMNDAARHLLSLMDDVLEMGKLEDGVEEIPSVPIDLRELTREIEDSLRADVAGSEILLQFKGEAEQLSPYVMGSPLHLRQIFMNIYGNCIKFTKPGGTVTTGCERIAENGRSVTYRWTISDTGIGMSEEFLKHIFEPFSQEHSGARTEYQGTGLGMAIVKALVQQMGGSIEVRSKKNVGTTFVLTLPFVLAEPDAVTRKPVSIAGLNLLLAEDNELNAEIAQILITDQGAKLTTVADGKQAVEKIANSPAGTYDAVLMDIMMPVMDGLEATRMIRAMNRQDAKTIPIIALTANAFEEDAEKCRAAGMNAHLTKPMEIDRVVSTIAKYCTRL